MKKHPKTKRSLKRTLAALISRVRRHPVLFPAAKILGAFLCGFLLASVPVLDRPVPAALGFLAVLPFGLPAFCCYLGAALGYYTFWSLTYALEPLAAGLLMLAGSCLLQSFLPKEGWARPLFYAGLYLAVALVFLLDRHTRAADVTFFALRLGFLARMIFLLQDFGAAGEDLLLLCLGAGLCRVQLFSVLPLSVPLLTAAAVLGADRENGALRAAACGFALDAALLPELPAAAAFGLAGYLCQRGKVEFRPLRAVLFGAVCLAFQLLLGAEEGALLAGIGLGGILACLIPGELLDREKPPQPAACTDPGALADASALLARVSRLLDRSAITAMEPRSAAVFDRAAEQLCRSCSKWSVCWERGAERTYLALSKAAGPILQRGAAKKDDLPPYFLDRCCHVEGFLAAVNEELDSQLSRRQFQVRMQETRAIVSDQYRQLSRFLTALSERQPEAPCTDAFSPELGFCAAKAGTVSGDGKCSFRRGEWYYVLLCDGMGTGEEARRESSLAMELVQGFLGLDFDAQDCLQLLNEVYILREEYGFSTIDLLQVSLVTGEGYLHKWGAAPSFLVQDGKLRKIGTAAPPPGLGVGEAHRAECVRLSLGEGELLILVSDGVDGKKAESFLSQCLSSSPREVAAGLVSGSSRADDRTVAAVRLRPVPIRDHHTTRRARSLSKFGTASHI